MAESRTPAAGSSTAPVAVLPFLLPLLAASRPAFTQERPFVRSAVLALGWLVTQGRHTVTGLLGGLGLNGADWSGFHRCFSRRRFAADALAGATLTATLRHSDPADPYLAVIDATTIRRHSRRFPGSQWVRARGAAPWNPGLVRAQRFLTLHWLPRPTAAGFSRAVTLRWDPVLSPTAVPVPPHRPTPEWAAGLAALRWLRGALDAAGRSGQRLLAVADGAYSGAPVWKELPAGVTLLARCAKNRALFALPQPTAKGRPRKYGEQQPAPQAWLPERAGWTTTPIAVRGRTIPLTWRSEGPVVVKGAPETPLFLLAVRGCDGRPTRPKLRREPVFHLVNAVLDATGAWVLPFAATDLLGWTWQRWECEVAHREQKSEFGVGAIQSWSVGGAVAAVQWAAWLYGMVVLAGIEAWGLGPSQVTPVGKWWPGSGRWSLAALWRSLRAEVWTLADFSPGWRGTAGDWSEMLDWLDGQPALGPALGRG